MNASIEELTQILNLRLERMECVAQQGVIPGQMDSIELEQWIGRIKELKHIIHWIETDFKD